MPLALVLYESFAIFNIAFKFDLIVFALNLMAVTFFESNLNPP